MRVSQPCLSGSRVRLAATQALASCAEPAACYSESQIGGFKAQVSDLCPGQPGAGNATLVPLFGTASAGEWPAAASCLLKPDVTKLLAPSRQARARREAAVQRREEKQQLKEGEYRQLVADTCCAPRPSEVMFKAEQSGDSPRVAHSRAAHDEQVRQQVQQRGESRVSAAAESGSRTVGVRRPSEGAAEFRMASLENRATGPAGYAPGTRVAGLPSPASDASAAGPGCALQASAARGGRPVPYAARAPAAGLGGGTATGTSAGAHQSSGPSKIAGSRITGFEAARSAPAGAGRPGGVAAPGALAEHPATMHRVEGARSTPGGGHARAAANTPAAGNLEANIERIVRSLQSRIGRDRAVATLRLDPPELGMIRLRMDLRNDQLALQVETQTAVAQRLLEDQLDTLRRSLEAAGIRLDRVEIRALAATNTVGAPGQPDASPWSDVPPGGQHGAAWQDAGSAQSGSQGEAESPPSQTPAALAGATSEPAAESLVNVWA